MSSTTPSPSPAQPGPAVYGFDAVGVKRVINATRVVENEYRNPFPERRRPPPPLSRGGRIAQTGAAGIPARAGANPGKAQITLYTFDGTTLTAVPGVDPNNPEMGYNLSTTAVGGSKWIQVKSVQGYWFADWEDC